MSDDIPPLDPTDEDEYTKLQMIPMIKIRLYDTADPQAKNVPYHEEYTLNVGEYSFTDTVVPIPSEIAEDSVATYDFAYALSLQTASTVAVTWQDAIEDAVRLRDEEIAKGPPHAVAPFAQAINSQIGIYDDNIGPTTYIYFPKTKMPAVPPTPSDLSGQAYGPLVFENESYTAMTVAGKVEYSYRDNDTAREYPSSVTMVGGTSARVVIFAYTVLSPTDSDGGGGGGGSSSGGGASGNLGAGGDGAEAETPEDDTFVLVSPLGSPYPNNFFPKDVGRLIQVKSMAPSDIIVRELASEEDASPVSILDIQTGNVIDGPALYYGGQ